MRLFFPHIYALFFHLVFSFVCPLAASDNPPQYLTKCEIHDYSSYATIESIDGLLDYVERNRGINEDSLLIHGCQATCASQAIGYREGEIHGLLLVGFDYYKHSNLDSALYYLAQGFFLAEIANHPFTLARAANYLGLTYHTLSHDDIAMSYQRQYYNISKELQDYRRMGEALTNMAAIYNSVNNPNESRRCLLEALELFNQLEVPSESYLWLYRALAISYAEEDDLESAETYFAKAIQIGKENNYPRGTCWTLYELAKYRFRNGDSNTMELIRELNTINKSDNINIHVDVVSRFHEAQIYLAQNNIEDAYHIATKALVIAQNIQLIPLSLELIDLLIEIADKRNAPLDKIQYLNQVKKIYSTRDNQGTKSLEVWTDLQNRLFEQERKNLQLQKSNVDAKQMSFYYKIIIGFTIFALVGAWIIVRARNKSKAKLKSINHQLHEQKGEVENQLETIQSQKNQLETYNSTLRIQQLKLSNELKQRIIEIAHKEEILDEMRNLVDKSEMPTGPKNKINKLIASHHRDTIWEDFDEQLALTHTTFFALLAQHAPELTNNDFRMSALIRMNLPNKEIARILRKSVQSIHMAQSRLRKKLRMTENDGSLNTFLNRLEGSIVS